MTDLELTKKAEANAAANYSQLEELPPPLIVDCHSRRSIADSIERLIDMLDAMSPDPDLEYGADDEPWLGRPEQGPHGSPCYFHDVRGSIHDDREDENEHGGDINDEPQAGGSGGTWEGDDEHSLGWTEEASQTGDLGCHGSTGDLEPELGWTEHVNQASPSRYARPVPWQVEDGEPLLGWAESHGKGVIGQQGFDDREGNDELEADPADYDQPGHIEGGQGV